MVWLFWGMIFCYLLAGIIICYRRNSAFLQLLADDAGNLEVADEEIESRYFEGVLQDGGLAIKACQILRYCGRITLAKKLAARYKEKIKVAVAAEAEHEKLPLFPYD